MTVLPVRANGSTSALVTVTASTNPPSDALVLTDLGGGRIRIAGPGVSALGGDRYSISPVIPLGGDRDRLVGSVAVTVTGSAAPLITVVGSTA